MSPRFLVLLTVVLLIGAASFPHAQDAASGTSPAACASPLAGSPIVDASPVASPAATPAAGCGTPVSFEIDAIDMAFKPKELTIPAKTPVELILVNRGLSLHNFGIDALKIDIYLVPGETRVITVTVPPGDYNYYCDIPGHAAAGMFGMLHAT